VEVVLRIVTPVLTLRTKHVQDAALDFSLTLYHRVVNRAARVLMASIPLLLAARGTIPGVMSVFRIVVNVWALDLQIALTALTDII